jgi:hypothetical protein
MHGKGTFEYNGTYYEGDFFMNIMQSHSTLPSSFSLLPLPSLFLFLFPPSSSFHS